MIEYKYQKVKGLKEKKFLENGHTMLETDVLQRLNRLSDLEEQIKQGELMPLDTDDKWTDISVEPDESHIEKRTQFLVKGYFPILESKGGTHCRACFLEQDSSGVVYFDVPHDYRITEWRCIK